MSEKALGANLEQYNKQLDDLNKKVDQVANSVDNLNKNNTSLNTSMVAMNQAIQNLGGAIPALTSAFQLYKTTQEQVNIACKAFAGNPVGATIQIIAVALGVINTIIDKFKEKIAQSDEATAKWNEAIAALDPILKGFNVVLGYVIDKFIDIVSWVVKGVEKIGKFSDAVSKFFGGTGKAYDDASKKAKEYAKLQNDLTKEERKRTKEAAESEARQGKLREQIAKAQGEQKKQLLKNLADEIKANTDAEISINKKRIALMKYKQSLSPTSAAEKQALADLEAETDRLIGAQGKTLAKIEKQIKSTNSSIAKSTKDAEDKRLKEYERFIKEQERIASEQQKEQGREARELQAQRALEDARLKLNKQTESEILQIKRERLAEDIKIEEKNYNERKRALENLLTKTVISEKDSAELKTKKREEEAKIREQIADLESNHEIELLNKQTESFKIEQERQTSIYKQELAKRKYDRESLENEILNNEDYEKEVAKKEKEHQEKMDKLQETIYGSMDMMMSQFDMLNEPQQMLFDSITATIGQISTEIDTFKQLGDGQQNAANKTKMAMKVIGQATQAAMAVTSKFMATKRQQIQQDLEAGKISEEQAKKEFEKTKKVEIAMAIMSTLGGIAGAIPAFIKSSIPMPAAAILGGALAATIAATGAMQIAQIKQTTLDTDGGGGLSASLPNMESSFNTGVSASPLLNEDYDLANINRSASIQGDSATTDQRVYIVESDIQDSNKRVQIREQETTF